MLVLHLFSNFLNKLLTILRIIVVFHWISKPFIFNIFFPTFPRKTIYTFYPLVAKLKEMKRPSESTERLTSLLQVFISSSVYDNWPWHFFCCRFYVLFGWTFACHFLGRVYRIFSFSRFLVVAMVVSIPLISLDIYGDWDRISNNLQSRDFRMISQFCHSEQHMITSFSFDHFFFFF